MRLRVLLFLMLWGGAIQAVEIGVYTSPDSLTVGDPVTVELRVEAPPGTEVVFQRPRKSRRVELLDIEVVPPGAADADNVWLGRYTLAVYAVGDLVLAPWSVRLRSGGQSTVVYTDSIRFHVQSILDDTLAAGVGELGVKEQVPVPVPPPKWGWVLLGALVLLAALLWWLWLRPRRGAKVAATALPVPPHERALDELRKLEAQQLPGKGKVKEHYVRLSEILRAYLERSPQFGFSALEETSYEILRELRERDYSSRIVDTVAILCEEADLVKFAKHEPTILECDAALSHVRRFVLETCRLTPAELHAQAPSAMVAS